MKRPSLHALQHLTLLWGRLAFVLVLISALSLPLHLAQHQLSPDSHPLISCELCQHAQPLDGVLPQLVSADKAFREFAPNAALSLSVILAQSVFLPPARGPPALFSN